MSDSEKYQRQLINQHIEQMRYHKRVASALLVGLAHKRLQMKSYEQESLGNLAQALN